MKRLTFILILLISSFSLFGQRDSTANKSKFYIGMAVNNIIPTVQNYQLDEESVFQGGDVSAQIFPKATVSLSINSGYGFHLFNGHKFNIAIVSEITFNYYKNMDTEVGYDERYSNGNNGTIFLNISSYGISLNILPKFSYSLNKKSNIALYAGLNSSDNCILTGSSSIYVNNQLLSEKIKYDKNSSFLYDPLYIGFLGRLEYGIKVNKVEYGFFIGTYSFTFLPSLTDDINNLFYRKIVLNYGLNYKF